MTRRFLPWLALTLVVVAVVVAMVVRGAMRGSASRGPSRIPDVVDLAPPSAITAEERASAAVGLDPQPTVTLEAGAWVEVADPDTGRLAQRYSSTQVEPLPDRHVRMRSPRASFHAQSGRVVTLEGDRATAHVPKRALQSGVIEGNVVIRLFQPDATGQVRLDRDAPALEVHAPEAAFDAEVGQLRCDHEVEIVTPAVRFRGKNLTLILDDAGDAPERVIVERALEPLRVDLARLDADAAARRAAPRPGATSTTPPSPASSERVAAAGSAAAAPASGTPGASGGGPSTVGSTGPAPGMSASAASPTAPVAAPTAPPLESAGHRFYRLTFHDDVHVVRERDGVRSTIDGHALSLTFSLDADQARRTVALPIEPAPVAFLAPTPVVQAPLAGTLLTLVLAADPPVSDVLTITYSGRLVMVPDPEAGRALTSPDDVRIEVAGRRDASGAVASRVDFADPSQALVGHCHVLRFNTLSKRLELDGTVDDPVDVRSARFSILSPEVRVAAGGGEGSLGGPGRITIRDDGPRACAGEPLLLAAAAMDEAILRAIAASLSGQTGAPAAPGVPAGPGVPGNGPRIPLEILWEDGVDLSFAQPEGGEETGGLRSAAFRGDVRVVGEDFAMRSDRLTVGFEGGGGGGEQSLSSIDAVGMVQVRRLGESASMDAQELRMTLARVDGRSTPSTLLAKGGVAARDANRTILAETLDVTFKPKAQPAPADANNPVPVGEPVKRDASSLGEQIGTVDIATVLANRDVRVQLEDGARVYADRLEGDSIAGALTLLAETGGEVLIVRDKVVADGMKEIRFDDVNRTAHAEGPGRFRFFAKPVELPPLQSRERPQAMDRPALEAAWTEAFHYADRAGPAAEGEITLRGDVNVRTEPKPEELDTLTAKELVLGMVAKAGAAPAPPAEGAPAGTIVASGKDIATLRASGGAELQAQRWPDAQRSGLPPQVFRVRGEALEYDLRTREAAVRSAGDLLVHDVTPGGAETANAVSTFGSKGTSNFAWKGGMEMRREAGSADRYLITLADEVEVLHGGLRREDELALTCDRLEVTVDRPDPQRPEAGPAGAAAGAVAGAAGGLDVGGDARLVRIRGVGGVLVETKSDAEQVSCHEFDYNVATGIATMRARPGDLVQAMVKGGFAPMRAASMRWDMREGRLQILGAASEVGR